MSKTLRLVTSTALGAILLLSVGVGATLAKPAGPPAPHKPVVEVIDLADDWCSFDGYDDFCTVRTGTVTIKTWADGSSESKTDMVSRVEITHEGAFVARYVTTVKDRTTSGADGSYTTDQRERTVWTDGTQTCVSESHFRKVDFDVKIDTFKGHCH